VINSLNKIFASKKAGVAMALLMSVVALVSLLPNFHHFLSSFVGLGLLLPVFLPAYLDDLKKHRPFGKEFLTKAFLATFFFFGLIVFALLMEAFSKS
jgi:4-hydroxybenzoate polyprenyltransferase